MRRRASLRVRLAGLVAIGATVVVAIAAVALYRDLSREISDALTTELEIRLAALDAEASDPALPRSQGPVLAQIVDPTGRVVSPEGVDPVLDPDEVEEALRGRVLDDRHVDALGRDARILARPLDVPGQPPLVGVAATSIAPLDRARTRLLLIVLVAGPLLAGATTVAAWRLAAAALRPVREMAERARSISLTSPGERLPRPPGGDELAELGDTLNEMLERIEDTLVHERAFVDDASHELRAPLAVLRAELELAAVEHGEDDQNTTWIASALEEVDRLATLADHLLILARADAGEIAPGDVTADLGDAAHRSVERTTIREGVTVAIDGSAPAVTAEPIWLERILTNLLTNAVRHATRNVSVTLGATQVWATVTVADDGPGFDPELLPRAFDRFTRGDTSRGRGGTGLGLAIVATLVTALGGSVRAGNGSELGGAWVEVRLPSA